MPAGLWNWIRTSILVGSRWDSRKWEPASLTATLGAAVYYATTGEVDSMFEALEGAYRERDMFLVYLQNLPFFKPYHADSRYESLLRRMNLASRAAHAHAAFVAV
jgi:hypothetical protein